MTRQPHKILIIKPSAMGDIIQALPVLSALRKSFPDSYISWLIRTEFAPLLQGHSQLNEIILFDRKYLGKAWKNPKAFGALVSLIKRLRKERFDLVLDLQGLFRTASLGWLSGCKARFGPRCGREFSRLFYTQSIRQEKQSIHLVDYFLSIAKAAGVDVNDVEFVLPVNSEADKSARFILEEEGIGRKNYMVLVPVSAHVDKCWPTERFAAVADKLADKFGFAVITVSSSSEKSLCEEVNNKAKTNVVNLAGKTDIPTLIALLRGARMVISNDTGPGHIAAALQVPIVMIFGRSNPARVHPYGRPQCIAAVEPDGRGDSINNFDDKYDIRHVTVDEVFNKVKAQIK
jgi:lipopolysaccharide heptosyltransferase I